MIRAVLDANVVASGVVDLAAPTNATGFILQSWEHGRFELITSDHLIAEIERTLTNHYFAARVGADTVAEIMSTLRREATVTPVVIVDHGVASHPEDDLVLAAAVSANADYLVTGDRQLQKLGSYREVRIVSPREFLAVLQAEHGENVGHSGEG